MYEIPGSLLGNDLYAKVKDLDYESLTEKEDVEPVKGVLDQLPKESRVRLFLDLVFCQDAQNGNIVDHDDSHST